MDAQLQASDHQMRIQQQPWVGVSEMPAFKTVWIPLKDRDFAVPGEDPKLRAKFVMTGAIKLENFGSTPALRVGEDSTVFVEDSAVTFDKDANIADRIKAIYRKMNATQDNDCFNAERRSSGEDLEWSGRKRDSLSGVTIFENKSVPGHGFGIFDFELKRPFTILGCVRYRDQFNLPHETRYCIEFDRKKLGPHKLAGFPCSTNNAALGIDTAREINTH